MNDTVKSFIEAEKHADRNVAKTCELLEVSRSAYYASINRQPSPRALSDVELTERIIRIHERSRRTDGAPRVHAELADAGIHVGRKRVARLMVAAGLAGRCKRRTKRTTIAGAEARAINIIDRVFSPGSWELDRAWCGDITYCGPGRGGPIWRR